MLRFVLSLPLVFLTVLPLSASSTIYQRIARSVVSLRWADVGPRMIICSGFVVDAARGWVLTATHCLPDIDEEASREENEPLIYLNQNLPAKIIRSTEMVTLLATMPMQLPPLDLSSKAPRIGDEAFSFGHGNGSPDLMMLYHRVASLTFRWTRPLVGTESEWPETFVLSGGFVAGMSGGPVINQMGQVIGMVQASDETIGIASDLRAIRAILKG